jgi:sugar lactone lactonase YvrE
MWWWIDGQELRRPDGRGVEFAADSIAFSPDGRTLYWKALTGRTLYRITTDALENPQLSEKDLEARVERVAETEPTDGLWIDGRGRLYLSAIEQDAVKVPSGPDGASWTKEVGVMGRLEQALGILLILVILLDIF